MWEQIITRKKLYVRTGALFLFFQRWFFTLFRIVQDVTRFAISLVLEFFFCKSDLATDKKSPTAMLPSLKISESLLNCYYFGVSVEVSSRGQLMIPINA